MIKVREPNRLDEVMAVIFAPRPIGSDKEAAIRRLQKSTHIVDHLWIPLQLEQNSSLYMELKAYWQLGYIILIDNQLLWEPND